MVLKFGYFVIAAFIIMVIPGSADSDSPEDCSKYCISNYGELNGEIHSEGNYPDCKCVVDFKDELGRLERTEVFRSTSIYKDVYKFDKSQELTKRYQEIELVSRQY